MKPSDIQVGKTYRNRGKGRTTRKVIAIGNEFRPEDFYSMGEPNGGGVTISKLCDGDIRKHWTVLPLSIFATIVFLLGVLVLGSIPRSLQPVTQESCVKYLEANSNPAGYSCVDGVLTNKGN